MCVSFQFLMASLSRDDMRAEPGLFESVATCHPWVPSLKCTKMKSVGSHVPSQCFGCSRGPRGE